jgi:hypothetical protein
MRSRPMPAVMRPTVTNVAGNASSAAATLSVGYEADINPRPTGNNSVTITDWVQTGRFAAGLDPLPTGSEFVRADCAPRSSLGNGLISLTDWVRRDVMRQAWTRSHRPAAQLHQ